MAEAGSVWVSVVPSLRGFSTKMKTELRAQDLTVTAQLTLDTGKARKESQAARKEMGGQVDLNAELDTRQARREAELAKKSMGGTVNFKTDIDTAGSLIKISLLSSAISKLALPAAIVGATPYLLSLGASAEQAAGGLALIPAGLLAGGLALTTFKLATSGVGKAISDAFDPTKAKALEKDLKALSPPAVEFVHAVQGVKPQFDALQSSVAGAFFKNMGTDVSRLAGVYMPTLSATLTGIAVGFNQVEGETAGWLLTSQGTITVERMMSNLGFAVTNVLGALAPLIIGFINIGAIGAPILAELTTGAGAVAFRFQTWTQSAQGILTIRGWILGAIVVIQQLWQLGVNVASILGSLFAGGQRSGESFLGILVRITGTMATALQTPAGASQLDAVLTGIRDVVAGLWDKIVILWPLLAALGGAFVAITGAASPMLSVFYELVVSALTPLANLLGFLAPVLGPILAGFIIWRTVMAGVALAQLAANAAMIVWNAAAFAMNIILPLLTGELGLMELATWAWNAALDANPIGIVIIAIAALVAGVIYAYNNFEWFRGIVDAVGQGFVWLWNTVLVPFGNFLGSVFGPVISWISDHWQLLVTILGIAIGPIGWLILAFTLFRDQVVAAFTTIWAVVSAVWTGFLQPMFVGIGTALAYIGLAVVTLFVTPWVLAWNGIILPVIQNAWAQIQMIWGFITLGLQFLGIAFMFLWSTYVVPAWNGIVGAITAAWNWINNTIFTPIKMGLTLVGLAMQYLWQVYVVPAWNGIMSALGAAWNWINSNVFGPIKAGLTVVGNFFTMLWTNYVVPAWNGIMSVAGAAWHWIDANVFAPVKAGINLVGQAFQFVSDWIGRAWATIKEAARAPVAFVVNTVYSGGIRPVWNGIAGLFGMAQLPDYRMATGGVLPGYTPGRDSVHALLSPGEGILVPEAVRGLGPAFVGWANAHFSGGRSNGGQGTPQGGFARGGLVQRFAGGGIIDAITGGGSAVLDFLTTAFTDATGAVRKLFAGVLGDNANVPGGGTSWTEALKGIPPKMLDAVIKKVKEWIASLSTMGGGNWAPIALQALALAGQSASNLGRVLAQIQIESGGNPRAINLTDVNAKAGHPSQGLLQTIPSTFNAYAGPLRALGITNPLANIYAAIKYAVARYGSLGIWPTRGGYDQGGVASGVGYMPKYTMRPERVLSPRQTQAFEQMVPLLSRMQSRGGTGIDSAFGDGLGGGPTLVQNIYPAAGQSETSIGIAAARHAGFEGRLPT